MKFIRAGPNPIAVAPTPWGSTFGGYINAVNAQNITIEGPGADI